MDILKGAFKMYVNKVNNDNKYFEQVESILSYSKDKINYYHVI